MATAEPKSTHSQQHQTAESASLTSEQDRAFFSTPTPAPPFFTPDSPVTIQAKSRGKPAPFFQPTGRRNTSSASLPDLQAMSAFESEDTAIQGKHIQRMPAFESEDNPDDNNNAAGSPIQYKLKIGQPGDVYEREADTMADRVVAISRGRAIIDPNTLTFSRPQQINRQSAPLKKSSEPAVDWMAAMRKGVWGNNTLTPSPSKPISSQPQMLMRQSDGQPPAASPQLESRLQRAKASGSPLADDTRTEMEDAFSSDFSGVHIHTGQEAASLNQSLGARAFTHGSDIFFNHGEYQPQSTQGKHLLAHELTHTLQQGQGIQRAAHSPTVQTKQTTPDLQRVAAADGQSTVSLEVVDISSGVFKPSEKAKGEIEAKGRRGLEVRTVIPGVTAEGRVKVKVDRQGNYDSIGKGSMPWLNDWAKQLGGMYVNYRIKDSNIAGGYASLKEKGDNTNDWVRALKKNSAALGGVGLNVGNLPTPVNKLENGKLTLGVDNLKVQVGGFVDAQFNLALENASQPKIEGTANIDVKGLATGTLTLDNTQGKLTGEVGLGIDYKSFRGEAKVQYKDDGSVDIGGKAAYDADKLSGEIEFVATDLETANQFGKDAIAAAGGKEKVQDAPPPAPVPVAKEGSKQRALAATGQLGFNLTEWFAGTVNVVVDGSGNITVIGRITPPAEIELFPQRNWEKEIITLEARAYYGVPLVGNLNVFANIGLYALAMLGPAKIYDIEVLGTYSTDPAIQRNIQISASLNISAYAGLRLRAEGGAGVELVGHDLRFGVGLNADVGVKAYADARPTIGYRDPGVFYISGVLEMVAQPMLGLGGDFFIELISPWWSPASDEKWTWPLFSKEWPLTDPIGISATLKDYELGSGKVPEVELKKPEFDPSKFMTNMVDNKLPSKSGAKSKGQGTFKEDGSVPKPDVASKKSDTKSTEAAPSKKGSSPPLGKSAKPDPKAEKTKDSMTLLADAAKRTKSLKAKEPFAKADLTKELNKLEGQIRGIDFSFRAKDDIWAITPRAGGKTGRTFELAQKDGKDTDASKLSDIDIPVKFVDKSHIIRVHFTGNRVDLLMASGNFGAMRQKLDSFSNTYIAPFREVGANNVANQIERHVNTVKGVIDSVEADMNRRLESATGYFEPLSIREEASRQVSSRLRDALRELSEKLSTGQLGTAVLGVARDLAPDDPVIFNGRAMIVEQVKLLEEYNGEYELLLRARSPDGQIRTPLLYREEGIRWHIANKPHHEPFTPLGSVPGGRVVIDKPHLNSGTRGSTNPPFYNQTIGGKTYNRRGHVVAYVFGGLHNISTNIVALTHAANSLMNSSVESPLAKEIRTNDSVYIYMAQARYPGGDTTKPVEAVEIKTTKIYPTKESQQVKSIPND